MTARTLTPDEEADLHWRFSGDVESALGMRSWLGPMQQRLVEGRTRSGSSPGGDESGRVAEAALRLGAVDRRLAAADLAVALADEAAGRPRREGWVSRVLGAYYGPDSPRAAGAGLGRLGRVATLAPRAGGAGVTDLGKAAEQGRKGDAEALAWFGSVRDEAEALLAEAQGAYASTRPARRDVGAHRAAG